MPANLKRHLPAAVLLIVVGLSFSPALRGGFIWDDHVLIRTNRYVRSLSHIGRALTSRFWDLGDGQKGDGLANVYYRPLVVVSFILDYQLWGLDAGGYHLTNILLHLAVTLLVYLFVLTLMRRLQRARGDRAGAAEGGGDGSDGSDGSEEADAPPPAAGHGGDDDVTARWHAALVAALFALHPSRTEAVSWIAGRTDVMMSLFFFVALRLFYRALDEGPKPARVVGAWVAFAAALLCKENAVTLCVLVPAADWLLLGRSRAELWRNARWCHGPLIAVGVTFLALRIGMLSRPVPLELTLLGRLNLVVTSLGYYGLMFINGYRPNPAIAPGYDPRLLDTPAFVAGLATLVVGLVVLVVALRRRRGGPVAWSALLAGTTLAPVCNIVPLALLFLVADRFIYLPWLGVAVLLVLAVRALSRAPARLLTVALLLLASTWAITVHLRSRDFQSERRFWLAAVTVDPKNSLSRRQLARELTRRREYKRAEGHLLVALANARGEAALTAQIRLVGLRLLRVTDHRRRWLERVRAFLRGLYELSLRDKPDRKRVLFLRLDNVQLRASARSRRALAILRRQRDAILELYGVVHSRLGNDAAARRLLAKAAAMPRAPLAVHLNLALASARALDLEAARAALRRAAKLDATVKKRVQKLGRGLDRVAQRLAAARKAGLTVGKPAPDTVHVQRLLGEIYVILKSPARAARHLRRAIELAPGDRSLREMLSLELAASGQLAQALAVVRAARAHFGAEPGLAQLERRVHREHARWKAKINR